MNRKQRRRSQGSAAHPRGYKDDANTSRELAEINREYAAKERLVRSGIGPASAPSEERYPKSFRIKPKGDT